MDVALQVRSKADNSAQEAKLLLNGARLFVGRGPECAVLLDGHGISRHHLGIDADGAALFITDLSSNGTWLNGKRLDQNRKSKVEGSDVIELPGYEIRVRVASSLESGTGSAASPTEETLAIPAAAGSHVGSLTALEKFVVLLAVASLALLLTYLLGG